jgi:hypothetical protein
MFGGAAELMVRRRAGGGVESILHIPAPLSAVARSGEATPAELQVV